MRMRFVIAALGLGVLGASAVAALEDRVLEFPTNYKTEFTRYYSGDRYIAEEQTIALYANAVALESAKTGKLAEGSVLVAEIFAAQKDANGEIVESSMGHMLPGDFKAIAVMERRAGWDTQYPDDLKVGDWEFELFSTAGENLGKDTTACRECHHPLTDTDFTWSLEHLAVGPRWSAGIEHTG